MTTIFDVQYLILGGIAFAVFIVIPVLLAIMFRIVVSTNDVHIVQSAKKTDGSATKTEEKVAHSRPQTAKAAQKAAPLPEVREVKEELQQSVMTEVVRPDDDDRRRRALVIH